MSFNEIIINMIIVSVPEEMFMALIALLLLQRYDFIDKYTLKSSFQKILLIVVIPCVLIFTYTLYGVELNFYIKMIINSVVFYALMLVLLRSNEFGKVALVSLFSMFVVIVSELSTNLILVYIFSFDVGLLGASPWINFVRVLPARIIQFSIVYIFYLKKNGLVSVSVLHVWFENLAYRKLVFFCISVDVFICLLTYNEFTIKKEIQGLPIETQGFIVISLFILIILNIVIPWITVATTYPVGMYRKKIRRGG